MCIFTKVIAIKKDLFEKKRSLERAYYLSADAALYGVYRNCSSVVQKLCCIGT